MAEQGRGSRELLTEEAARDLRNRPGLADLIERHRWLATAVVAAFPGVIALLGLLANGSSVGWAVVGGVVVTVGVVGCFALASLILGRPVLPEIFVPFDEPAELLEGQRWSSREAAEREARARNLQERVYYWCEVKVSAGSWGIERRRFRGGSDQVHDFGVGDYGWFGDVGGGGGDGGGGG